ncbi:RNA polymerase sigma factor [Rhizobium bangladeshense]|nr:RNA polymerase sigma factor [Rhizobium bangladeshense]
MSVARTHFPAYSRARRESPVHPALSKSAGSAEAAIASEADIRSGLTENLARLWRYGLVLSHQRDVADDLVQATCLRALERADQFVPGTRLDRWLFSILHSIWLNEIRSRRVRQGQGFVDAGETLTFDGAHDTETHVMAGQVLKQVNALPEAQRTVVFLAYVEGLSYREVAGILDIPIGTVMSRLAAARAKLSDAGPEGGR